MGYFGVSLKMAIFGVFGRSPKMAQNAKIPLFEEMAQNGKNGKIGVFWVFGKMGYFGENSVFWEKVKNSDFWVFQANGRSAKSDFLTDI